MRLLRTAVHTLMIWAALQLLTVVATGVLAQLLAPVSHWQFLTLSAAAAIALNRDGIAGAILLASMFFTGNPDPVAIACALGAGLLLGTLLRKLIGGTSGQPVPSPTPGPGVRAAHGDARPDWGTSDPFGVDRAHRAHRGRPAADRGDDDFPTDGRRRPAQ